MRIICNQNKPSCQQAVADNNLIRASYMRILTYAHIIPYSQYRLNVLTGIVSITQFPIIDEFDPMVIFSGCNSVNPGASMESLPKDLNLCIFLPVHKPLRKIYIKYHIFPTGKSPHKEIALEAIRAV